jgi:mRNA interferase MazF
VTAPKYISQGELWWADLSDPVGSAPGYPRPVVIVQGYAINQSRIATVICVPLTSNLKWAHAPGNVLLTKSVTGLDRDAVANVSLIVAIDRHYLIENSGRISERKLQSILSGLDILFGR